MLSQRLINDSCASRKNFFLKYQVSGWSYNVLHNFLPAAYPRWSPTIVNTIEVSVIKSTIHRSLRLINTITDIDKMRSDGNKIPKNVPVSIILDIITNIKIPEISTMAPEPDELFTACCNACGSHSMTVVLRVVYVFPREEDFGFITHHPNRIKDRQEIKQQGVLFDELYQTIYTLTSDLT